MTLGAVILLIVAAAALIVFETIISVPEEGKWARPRYVALEVVIAGLVIFLLQSWLR